jgi:alkylation response protein AidB-like acyl-CoA dehydrogenase
MITAGTVVQDLEARLDDPAFAPDALVALDRVEAFPDDACRVLDEFGLHRYYIPARYGGLLDNFGESLQIMRAVARRDLTVTIAHGKTFLGAVSVWVGGNPDQATRLAAEIDAGTIVSWGLTERDHGSDLFAGELTAVEVDGGWELTGEKWLINNATRGQLICVLARTRTAGGPRGFSMFLVDKRELAPERYRYLPKVLTHGIRGADISGIVFDGARIPASALVGAVGDGLAITLKALQLTRTGCAALSLGAADHALRLAVDARRDGAAHSGGDARSDDRRMLGGAAAALLVAEATSVVASRSIHALTTEMNAVSAITKAFVPTLVAELLDEVATLLGPQACAAGGVFEKLRRDHPIVGIFDGSTLVNRNALINQFPKLARSFPEGRPAPWDTDGLVAATTLAAPLPAFDPAQLSLLSRAGCSLVQSLPNAVAEVRTSAPEQVVRLAEALEAETVALHEELARYVPSIRDVPPAAFRLAERYELCFAGAACLRIWLGARDHAPGPLWQDALWLRASLARILARLGADVTDDAAYDELADVVLAGGGVSLLPAVGGAR